MTEDGTDSSMIRAEARVGAVLRGKYRLDRVLGVGGMAVVYAATHRNEARFAVKLLHPELSLHDEVRSRFLREGRAANSVKHPGVVLVVDDDVAEDGSAFLVMELLDGMTVETLWERCGHRLPLRAVLAIGAQLLDVLAAAHDKGVVHRDIKPANLFVSRDGALKVLDFGIARVKDTANGTGAGRATGAGLVLGTPAFMAPEQALGRTGDVDGRTDLWAVGATLFNLITGKPVHDAENAAQQMIRTATTKARATATVASHIPAPVAEVIDRALAFDKGERWPTALAMREAVERASRDACGEPPSRSALSTLLAEAPLDSIGATLVAPLRAPPESALHALASTPPPARRRFGETTATPVSSGRAMERRYLPRRRSAAMWIAAATATLGLTVAVASRTARSPSAAASLSAPVSAPRSDDVARVTLPALSDPIPAVVTVATVGAAPDPAQARPTTPTGTVRPRANPSPKGALTSGASPSRSASVAAPPLAVPPPDTVKVPSTPACALEKSYDSDGQPHFKKVCK